MQQGSSDLDMDISFWEPPFNPLHCGYMGVCVCVHVCVGVYYAKEQSLSKALVNTCCQGDTVWKHNDKRERHRPCLHGGQSLLGNTEIKLFLKVGKCRMRENYTMVVYNREFTLSIVVNVIRNPDIFSIIDE